MITKFHFVLSTVVVSLMASVAPSFSLLSLRWPVVHDLPTMLYEGYLIHEVGLVPYVDFFDMNPPGTMVHQRKRDERDFSFQERYGEPMNQKELS